MSGQVIQGRFQGSGPRLPVFGKPVMQPKTGAPIAGAQQLPPGFLRSTAGGRALPDVVRTKMEFFFKADFSDIRVHVGPEAPSIGALAFTTGSNLYFAPGQYNPDTPQGQALLGHELTHVIQQRQGRVRNPFGNGIAVVQDRNLEAEADRMGQRAALSRAPATNPPPAVTRPPLLAAGQMKPHPHELKGSSRISPILTHSCTSPTCHHPLPAAGFGNLQKSVQMVAKKNTRKKPRIVKHKESWFRDKLREKFVDLKMMRLAKKIHRSNLYVGSIGVPVAAKSMTKDRLFVRHLSSALLETNREMVEVQSAVNNSRKCVYVACNTKESHLLKFIGDAETVDDIDFSNVVTQRSRVTRHVKKLPQDISASYSGYKIYVVRGLAGQHAETKIVGAGKQFDYIGGTRRPCFACTLFFKLHGVHESKYNPHYGAYWDSNTALKSYVRISEQSRERFKKLVESNKIKQIKHFYNENATAQEVYDYDTDSDNEDDYDD
ncbi:DUF4157 domain-containing protein [Niveispirillum sp. SYP-B3756]|uniref:eCIS core domain-containing protein n=1 Tax=Niveispirillum sp. SYP-B3756 TaxID=2662178 RepID=UPI00129136C4|nr:DUF4157 domain-containing protein [Niveispirillum sp. SYP-B3756]MQP67339.1 DUF4157 domain-containing protein [Niveispirillum sp. SYP-B3756]